MQGRPDLRFGPQLCMIDVMNTEPIVSVGIIDGRNQVKGWLEGQFRAEGVGLISGGFVAQGRDGQVLVSDETGATIEQSPVIRLMAEKEGIFRLFGVTIGNRFHWERPEDQTFRGGLTLLSRPDGTLTAINEIPLEHYLASVISSEMSAEAPIEFLKAHAIMSRSWLMAALERKKEPRRAREPVSDAAARDRIIRWYEREDHDLFDVCGDDHCQRYHGMTKIISHQAEAAVAATFGRVLTYNGAVCDARFSKCCGGLTENFRTAWEDRDIDYLSSVCDSRAVHHPVLTEVKARRWILSEPEVHCNTKDDRLLEKILPDFDRETRGFFRWTITYLRAELEEILKAKSGLDFGVLQEIVPLHRGPSGRISSLSIVGSQRTVTVGKELEIRRWLSPTHLYSSAFVVTVTKGADGTPEAFTFHGAGWGHGVGLCQIGAAVMADRGFSSEEILRHYFRGVDIEKAYERSSG